MSDAVACGGLGRGATQVAQFDTNRHFTLHAGTFAGDIEDTKGREKPELVGVPSALRSRGWRRRSRIGGELVPRELA